jgi:hypothetical protein
MSVMTITAIILLIIGPLPWYALLIIVGRELRWQVQDKERAGARLLWLLFAGYILEMEILIFAICRSLQINTGETIFALTGGALTIMGFHIMASVSTVDHVFDKAIDMYDSLRGFPLETSSR